MEAEFAPADGRRARLNSRADHSPARVNLSVCFRHSFANSLLIFSLGVLGRAGGVLPVVFA
jgi:hypothetical protein